MCGKTTIWHLVSVERIEGAGHLVHDKGRGDNPPKQYAKGGTDFGSNSADFELRTMGS